VSKNHFSLFVVSLKRPKRQKLLRRKGLTFQFSDGIQQPTNPKVKLNSIGLPSTLFEDVLISSLLVGGMVSLNCNIGQQFNVIVNLEMSLVQKRSEFN